MLNESAMKKWFKFEMAKINSGVVLKKRSLKELLAEEQPQTKAKDDSIYYFNKKAIIDLGKELPEDLHSILLPLNIYISLDSRSNVYIADVSSLNVLKSLGEIPYDGEFVDGRYWMGKALILDLMKRRPSIIQLIRY